MRRNTTLLDLLDRISITENGCWEYTGGRDKDGYGVFSAPKGQPLITAHRFSYSQYHGPIPDGMLVCHRCDNPPCVNPDHLFLGSALDNQQDMKAKGRHRIGERNGRCKIDDAMADEIRKGYTGERGEITRLGKKYGVQRQTIAAILWRAY